jgi:hypothetical protein
VQDEREPLGRRQPLQHDQQRQPDGVGEERLLLGVGPVLPTDDRLGHVHVERLLATRLARAEHVERDPRHDRRQPAGQVVDSPGVGAAQAQPRLLQRVVGLAHRAEHPVGHRSQAGPVVLELLCQPVAFVHGHIPRSPFVIEVTTRIRKM